MVLIDGMPGNIYTLNPNDIESVSVLKDAASAAIYGSRAANGVVLVTTKTAKATERPTVEFSSNIGIQNPQFKLDFVGSEDFMRLYDQAMINDGKDAIYGEQGIQDLRAGKYVDNKWYKEIYKKNTIINNTHLALSGKERSIAYRFSISNDYQDGNLPNNNYNRLIFKPDMRFQILKKPGSTCQPAIYTDKYQKSEWRYYRMAITGCPNLSDHSDQEFRRFIRCRWGNGRQPDCGSKRIRLFQRKT